MKFGLFKQFMLVGVLAWLTVCLCRADTVTPGEKKEPNSIGNEWVTCSVVLEKGTLTADVLEARKSSHLIETDADFGLDVQWTGWLAPGKLHNAANPVMLTKKNFRPDTVETRETGDGGRELVLILKSTDRYASLEVRLTYRLEPGAFYVKRRLAVRDTKPRNHFLRWLWPRRGVLYGDVSILKSGGFGRPLALRTQNAGAFLGLEYPAAENLLEPAGQGKTTVRTGQEMGVCIGSEWIEGEWSVLGLTPDTHVKLWFKKYLDRIRVAPLKPYLLYNTWYDVRSPEYTKRPEDVMNEANLMRIIGDFKREMVEKRGLKLDAFVLDDAWDIYKSDWVLRKKEFPNGLKPIREALKTMGTDLGIWFGPIGGYSYRNWRVDWMKEHGYEVVGDQLCLAGTKYRELFKKRTVDFVRDDGVAYFKWDGIQFSCSEPDHGHPVGIYSRRAVMESVVELCDAVRAENPGMYLNITSGTWLSPWWVKYANMIWMQGRDYGYSDVPSVSRRDAAITYRDVVLYENYGVNDFWFPLSNLMTHGIIKGHLQKLGGETEPLDKFTDNAILYFARGVSMWELYVSPNLLTAGEWDAVAKSIGWAKHRFDVLKTTEMVGGDPGNRETYGYVHFSKNRGIVAARNPFMAPGTLKVKLDPARGLCARASSLVLERVYPSHWISPRLYAAGAEIELPLRGYETAIYEIYPLEQATEPLLGGTTFGVVKESGKNYVINVRDTDDEVNLLNPRIVKGIRVNGEVEQVYRSGLGEKPAPVKAGDIKVKGSRADVDFVVEEPLVSATLCFLVEPSEQSKAMKTVVTLSLDGRKVEAEIEAQEGRWAWYKVDVPVMKGKHGSGIRIRPVQKKEKWTGTISAWMVYRYKPWSANVSFELVDELPPRRPMPPAPLPEGIEKGVVKF